MDIGQTPGVSTAAASPIAQGTGAISSDFNTFLRMLTTQLQNQDPLNPMESSDFAVQLATFSGVEQAVRTNDLLTGLAEQMMLMSMSQLGTWVGMEARVVAPVQFDGAPIELSPDPHPQANRAELVVRNAAGSEVQRSDLAVPTENVAWAGVAEDGTPLPPGLYSFTLESYSGTTKLSEAPVEAYATITEVRSEAGAIMLVLEGGSVVAAGTVSGLRTGR